MNPKKLVSRLLTVLCGSVLLYWTAAYAADYPTRQIELVVVTQAGGGTDLLARTFADVAKKYLPQPIGVVNKPGGGGAVGYTEIAASRPDGYRIGVGNVEISMLPHMGVARFTAEDFTPIAMLNVEPGAITVKEDAPWKTVEEFLSYAKDNPGKVRVGNSGTGGIWHLAAAALEDKTGVKFNHIPYDGANPAVVALLGGHIEAVTVSPAEVVNHVRGGKLRILGIMADQRSKGFDEVPTLKENGIDVTISTWRGIVVPKGTPKNVVDVLIDATRKTANDQSFRDALVKLNMTWHYAEAPQYQEVINRDNAFFKALMGKLGIAK
ncbi:ABC transporter substrate-binding protein [Betaproteobacteria bacterium]|nr:ABC transporter substrate-binding protein [Betaproteobacteria bacterium]